MTTLDATIGLQLRAICDDPADDGARLIYADLLEERGASGDAEYAEFIRVQVEIARNPGRNCGYNPGWRQPRWCSDPACPSRQRHVRERDLFTFANIEAWGFRSQAWLRTTVSRAEFEQLTRKGTPTALIRRGFIAEVTCALADWVGGRCPRCEGRGKLTWPEEAIYTGGNPYVVPCGRCHGSGRIPGHGPAIVQAQPVEFVRTDREPRQTLNVTKAKLVWTWWCQGEGLPIASLPLAVWNCLLPPQSECAIPHWRITVLDYDTEAAAYAALSAALLAWARQDCLPLASAADGR